MKHNWMRHEGGDVQIFQDIPRFEALQVVVHINQFQHKLLKQLQNKKQSSRATRLEKSNLNFNHQGKTHDHENKNCTNLFALVTSFSGLYAEIVIKVQVKTKWNKRKKGSHTKWNSHASGRISAITKRKGRIRHMCVDSLGQTWDNSNSLNKRFTNYPQLQKDAWGKDSHFFKCAYSPITRNKK